MKKIAKIQHLLIKTLNNNISFCILLLLFIVSPDLYYFLNNGHYLYSIYILFQGIILSYIITTFISLFKNKAINNILAFLFVFYAIFILVLDIYCIIAQDDRFNKNFAAIVLQTNVNETFEFLDKYITLPIFLTIIGTILLIIITIIIVKQINKKNKVLISKIYIILVFCGIPLTIRNYGVYTDGWLGKLICFKESYIPNLRTTYSNPIIQSTNTAHPSNVVLIIGESYNKHHSSLYGYKFFTSPRLTSLKDSSLLYVFNNVTSAATHTIESFQCILNTYKPELRDSIKWYNSIHLHEILNLSNYYTYWISNQSENGMFDNVASAYGALCNEQYWVRNKYHKGGWDTLDDQIIELTRPLISQNHIHKFFFIHLLGSHSDFKKRYPQSFNRLIPNDYNEMPINQRQTLAEYDNSILYNDSVIYEVIDLYKEKEAIIIYTADHGLDIFQSNKNYAGHAKINNKESVKYGSEIPLFIYTSPLYKKNYPQAIKSIENNLNKEFRTDDLIYTIMDIIGVSFKNNNDVTKYSLFNGIKYN